MLGEFKCDQHDFVHLFRKNLFFDINSSTEFLSTRMLTFLANLFQNNQVQESCKEVNCNFWA